MPSDFAPPEDLRLNPRLRGKPIAIIPVETDSTCAIAASYEAKKMCPGLICVLAGHGHYVEFHQRILEEIDNHIPVAAVCSIDEMACIPSVLPPLKTAAKFFECCPCRSGFMYGGRFQF